MKAYLMIILFLISAKSFSATGECSSRLIMNSGAKIELNHGVIKQEECMRLSFQQLASNVFNKTNRIEITFIDNAGPIISVQFEGDYTIE